MSKLLTFVTLAVVAQYAAAAVPVYGQCVLCSLCLRVILG